MDLEHLFTRLLNVDGGSGSRTIQGENYDASNNACEVDFLLPAIIRLSRAKRDQAMA
ncbi:hypothetical protein [Sphingomonas sp.]|uniref:hypothetical protein n=1 Tax=Sphingomonas sp. TaxID=28214 RepID=UPI003D6C7D41